jgi:hypothetical protein
MLGYSLLRALNTELSSGRTPFNDYLKCHGPLTSLILRVNTGKSQQVNITDATRMVLESCVMEMISDFAIQTGQ